MSIYAHAAGQGIGLAQLALTGENAATKQAYNAAYAAEAQRYALAAAKNTAEGNISSLKQDKILSDARLEVKQSHAEAAAKLSAATAGVSGTNVDQVIYMTEVNESMLKQQNAQQTNQAIEQQATQVGNMDLALSGVPEPDTGSLLGDLATAGASISRADFKRSAALAGDTPYNGVASGNILTEDEYNAHYGN